MNFPPSTDTVNIQLHMEQVPLKEIQNKLSDSYTSGEWESKHSEMVRKSWDTLSPQ